MAQSPLYTFKHPLIYLDEAIKVDSNDPLLNKLIVNHIPLLCYLLCLKPKNEEEKEAVESVAP